MKYGGLPDEDLDFKVANFMSALELVRITEDEDALTVLPLFLKGQATLTYRTSVRQKVTTLQGALSMLKDIFLSEEARRASDALWEGLNYSSIVKEKSPKTYKEALRFLLEDLERLRNYTSHASSGNEETIAHITRA